MARVAARGAVPAWCTAGLTLPEGDDPWLAALRDGLAALARSQGVALVGGDTTRGPLSLTLCCHGPTPLPLAGVSRAGDLVYVLGELGGAALGLLARSGELRLPGPDRRACERALDLPEPPVAVAPVLAAHARAAAVTWDGLEATLEGLLGGIGLGATLHPELLPVAGCARPYLDLAGGPALALRAAGGLALTATVEGARQGEFEVALAETGLPFAWVGTVERTPGVRALDPEGMPV
jgi:thiamine-monophosphate kinase